jgi:hypothetical protein
MRAINAPGMVSADALRAQSFAKSLFGRGHFHFFRQAGINVIARMSAMNGI